MKIKMVGGGSFYGPHGVMLSFAPGTEVDVDDGDETAVAFWATRVESGAATQIEAPAGKVGKAVKAAAKPAEPEPEPEPEGPPPAAGPGSSRDAWVAYAETIGVEVTDDMSRDDIIDAVDDA